MEKNVERNRKIALTGGFSALIVVLGITRLGFISLSPTISLTIMHIPVILAAIMCGLPGGIISGAVFGIFSLVQAAMSPSGGLDPLFVNPLISILPRMLFGLAAWGLWKLFTCIPHMPKPVCAAVSAFLSTLVHTCLVIGSIYLLYNAKITEAMGGAGYIAGLLILAPNALMEAAAAVIVCSAVIGSVTIAAGMKSRLSRENENNQESAEEK